MDPEFERRLLKPANNCVRSLSNGTVASPLSQSPAASPLKMGLNSGPATPLSSPSLRRKLLFPRAGSSPLSSPSKERYGDRFIPTRSGNNWETNFSSIPVYKSIDAPDLAICNQNGISYFGYLCEKFDCFWLKFAWNLLIFAENCLLLQDIWILF